MSMNPWLAITLFGLAVFGFAWMTPRLRENEGGSDPAYDRLLEELETENRELLEAISKFKDEQDKTIKNLVGQIEQLEKQVKTVAEQASAASASIAHSAPSASNEPAAENAAAPQPAAPRSAVEAPSSNAAAAVPEHAETSKSEAQPEETSRYAPPTIRERYKDLLEMYRKGKSVDQIAKSAGMNKGEVQLILQLAKREEEQLA